MGRKTAKQSSARRGAKRKAASERKSPATRPRRPAAPEAFTRLHQHSTNEELETAKEELQSANEELTTVNEELQNRNLELTQVNGDLLNLLAGTTLAIVMLDAKGRLRRFTPQAEKLLNLIPTDVGRRIRDIKPNLKIADLEEIIMTAIETVQGREVEVQDREGRWYLMRAEPYRTTDNRVDGAVIAFIDIDPLRRSLAQVHEGRDYAEALVETVREALVVLDDTLTVRAANASFYRIFRTTPAQTEGRPLLERWGLHEAVPHLRGLLERASRGNESLQDVEISLDDDGLGRRTFLLNARAVPVAGEPPGRVVLAIEDITDRKTVEIALRASEAQYRLIFETAREGIWLMDAESGRLLDVNPFVLDLLGYSREELIGHRPWEVGLYEDGDGARARFEASLAGGFGFEQEVSLRTKTGQPVYVEAITNTYRLGDRLVTQANLRDVTERTKLQDQVRQMQKLDSIGRLAGGVAHDFNNLLNIISAHVGLLARDGLAADKRSESAKSIEKAVERGSAVVRQLLTFARKTDVTFEPTDVNTVVEELASMLRETFPKPLKVQTKLAEKVPKIHADPNQLHQALLNLAVNARDAMPEGGVLTLGTDSVTGETLRAKFPEAAAERYVELCVADTGGGMDAETRRRIFEPFFTTKGAKGQGLGLAVVYGIVNAHRGWIDLESEAGKGTTFRLYFAVSEPEVAVAGGTTGAGRRKEPRQLTASSKPKAPGGVLLVVEDEEMLLRPVRELLEENGYEVLTALDGVEAVRCFEANAGRISAVLLDLGLPRLGGWQAFLKMRERDPTLRCIVASGNLDPEQRIAMEKAGVQASVRKPYSSAQILKVVREALS
ncbi:MAG: PAS domain S-box protein [Syntrophomonadaceae bacterium]